jgi:hypothetical protein
VANARAWADAPGPKGDVGPPGLQGLKGDPAPAETAISAKTYGAIGNGVVDDTVAIQQALDAAAGRPVFLPAGTYNVSIARSRHANACLLIPAGTRLAGAGMGQTIIQRLPAERGSDGVLLCNEHYDTAAGYAAAGNLVLSDFTITDGAAAPNRVNGDLVGLGHAQNVVIQRVQSLNHDQHFVDICASRNVTIRDCLSSNGVVGTGNAIYQVDGAVNLGIWGLNLDGTCSERVTIENNRIEGVDTDIAIWLNHANGTYQDIVIQDNVIDLSATPPSAVAGNAIATDATATLKRCTIARNTFIVNSPKTRCINLLLGAPSALEDCAIVGNTFKGLYRIGVFVGNPTGNPATAPQGQNIKIADNVFEWDLRTFPAGANTPTAIQVQQIEEAFITGNSIRLLSAGMTYTGFLYGIFEASCGRVVISNNRIRAADVIPAAAPNCFAIQVDSAAAVTSTFPTDVSVIANSVRGSGWRYGISHASVAGLATYLTSTVRGNDVQGTFVQADYNVLVQSTAGYGPRMTTAKRDSMLAVTDGEIIYNTTLSKTQVREAGAWVNLV